ncbi:MAG TPA: hypothetical protein VJJ22_05250 [Candidatus Paceibacterota bacterium]
MLTGKFEKGDRGMICRRPSDKGAWVVPINGSRIPESGVKHSFEVVKTSSNGKLRFAKLLESEAEQTARYPLLVTKEIEEGRYTLEGFDTCNPRVIVVLEGATLNFSARKVDILLVPYWDNPIFTGEILCPEGLKIVIVGAHEAEELRQAQVKQAREEAEEQERLRKEEYRKRCNHRHNNGSYCPQCADEEDTLLLEAFYLEHPEAVQWKHKPEGFVPWNIPQIGHLIVKHGLATPIDEWEPEGGKGDRGRWSVYVRDYVIIVAGKEVRFTARGGYVNADEPDSNPFGSLGSLGQGW